jgi:hypothetical protein
MYLLERFLLSGTEIDFKMRKCLYCITNFSDISGVMTREVKRLLIKMTIPSLTRTECALHNLSCYRILTNLRERLGVFSQYCVACRRRW